MKYFKRLKIYKANNVTFDPETMIADSYDWWHFVERINGKVVFNDYNYSPTTNRHQSKVWALLRDLDIKIDLVVRTKRGLQASYGESGHKELALEAMRNALRDETLAIAERVSEIFQVELTPEFIADVYREKEEELCDAYLERAYQYSEKRREAKKLAAQVKRINQLVLLNGEGQCYGGL